METHVEPLAPAGEGQVPGPWVHLLEQWAGSLADLGRVKNQWFRYLWSSMKAHRGAGKFGEIQKFQFQACKQDPNKKSYLYFI